MPTVQDILPNGTYLQPGQGYFPIANSAVPTPPLTGVIGSPSGAFMHSINLPAIASLVGIASPDAELIFSITWSCNSSVNTKTLSGNLNNINVKNIISYTDVQTTNISNEWNFRVSCRNNTGVQVANAVATAGASTTAVQNVASLDFNLPLMFTFYGTLANAADTMQIERYSVWLSNGPSYKAQRFNYGTKYFWGGNSHFDDYVIGGGPNTAVQGTNALTTMGMSTMRITYEFGAPLCPASLVAMAQQCQIAGKQMICCIDIGIQPATTPASNYAVNYAAARSAALLLSPYGVTIFECGNEMDTKAGINPSGDPGARPASFSNALWPFFRETIRGAIDGVHSVPGCVAASNAFTICGIGASDMLWNGTAPDGSSGYTKVRWDITSWHNYRPYGPVSSIETYSNGGWVNIPEYLARAYGVPQYWSEFGGQSGDPDATNALWDQYTMGHLYNNRYKYNIMGCAIYQLWQGGPWSMFDSPGVINAARGTPIQTFIAANPDTGL
jgi:hypothetical protein